MTQDKTSPPRDFMKRHGLGPDRSQPTAAHGVAQKLAAMRTRCAALEVEAAGSTTMMHAEREKTDAALLLLAGVAQALQCEAAAAMDPGAVVVAAQLRHDEVVLHRAAVARVREALSCGRSPHAVEALRVLDEGLVRSRGAR